MRGHESINEPSGHGGGEQRFTLSDNANGSDDVFGPAVLEQEAARSGSERLVDVLIVSEHGQHHHFGRVVTACDPPGCLDARHPRHLDVHQEHVGDIMVDFIVTDIGRSVMVGRPVG